MPTQFEYMKVPLHKHTFKPKKLRLWVENKIEGKCLNLFAGIVRLNCDEVRNDMDPTKDAEYHEDALQFVENWDGDNFNTILLDSPYGYRKSMEMYNGFVASPFNQLKNVIPRVLEYNGIVITFGYHSISMGAKRDFTQERVLLMYHGGAIHDTIAVVERYIA